MEGESTAGKEPALEPEDYYSEGPYLVFTAAYHLKRGYCCGSGCRHCPYGELARGTATADPLRQAQCRLSTSVAAATSAQEDKSLE